MKKFFDDRPQLGWAIALVVVFVVALTAAQIDPADEGSPSLFAAPLTDSERDEIRDHAQAIVGIVGDESTTTTTGEVTTTSGVTTTVTEPPTTTTTVPPDETIIHPRVNSENGYYFGVSDLNTGLLFWRAPYHHELLYQPNTGWQNGERLAYHCMYGFLFENGKIRGRFTVRAVPTNDNNPDGAYVRVNDTYMEEARGDQTTAGGPTRFYDGSINSTGEQGGGVIPGQPFAECPQDVGIEYEPGDADERPIIPFWNDGRVIEIRDYRGTVAAPGVTFEELDPITEPFQVTTSTGTHTVNDRRSVLARFNGLPVAVIYYDGLGTGTMFPGGEPEPTTTTTAAPTTTTAPPTTTTTAPPTTTTTAAPTVECNAVISMSQGAQVWAGSQAGASDPTEANELEAATGDQWMALINGGPNTLPRWKAASIWGGIVERGRCAPDDQIDNVLFIFDPRGSTVPFTDDLNVVVGILQNRYPNAVIKTSLLVGGVNSSGAHVICTVVQNGQTQNVTASVSHSNGAGLMVDYPFAGPDLHAPCGYADQLGHLLDPMAVAAQGLMADFYSGG